MVKRINSTLHLHRTERCRADLSELFGLRAYSTLGKLETSPPLLALQHVPSQHDDQYDLQHDDNMGSRNQDINHMHDGISTILIPLPVLSTAQLGKLTSFLESLLWESKLPSSSTSSAPEILRTKGYIEMQDGRSYILQGVTDLFELTPLAPDQQTKVDTMPGKVVFIGRGIQVELSLALKKYIGINA